MINALSLFFLLSSAVTIYLGIWVYLRNLASRIFLSWFIFCFFVALWSLGLGILTMVKYKVLADIFYVVHYVGAINIPIAFLYFVRNYFLGDSRIRWDLKVGIFLSISLTLLFFSGHLVSPLTPKWKFSYYTNPGLLYPVYMLYFFAYVVFSFYWMIKSSLREENQRLRSSKIFFIVATLIGYLCGSSAFLLVYFDSLPPYGIYLFLLFPMITTYSIVKYGFMDLEIIVKRTLVFAGIVFASACLVSLPLMLVQLIIGSALGIPRIAYLVLGAMTTALIYRPVARRLVDLTDKYLFQKKVNYRLLLREASGYLAELASLRPQARRIVSFLLKRARITNASVYVFEAAQDGYVLKASRPALAAAGGKGRAVLNSAGVEGRPIVFQAELTRLTQFHPIIQHFYKEQGPLHLEQLFEKRKSEECPRNRSQLDEITRFMNILKAEAAIPCFGGPPQPKQLKKQGQPTHLRGILFLGHQKSDEPYREEDLDVFYTLGQESSIAFENARLYDAEIQRVRELEEINEKMSQAQTDLMRALEQAEQSRKEAERAKEEIETMQQELVKREKLQFVAKLVRDISHEIQNPLLPIRMRNEALRNDIYVKFLNLYEQAKANLDEPMHKACEDAFLALAEVSESIETNVNQIFVVIDTLRSSAEGDETIRPIDFKALFKTEILPLLEANTPHGDRGIEIVSRIDKRLPPIRANGAQLRQVILNLYKNAQFAMNGQPEKKFTVSAKLDEESGFVRLEFADTGKGILPEVMEKLFVRGFTTKGAKGTGAGLYQSKVIVEKFGGTIVAKSEVDKGATFIIRLPIEGEKGVYE